MKTSEAPALVSIDREADTADRFLSPAMLVARYDDCGPSLGTLANWRSEALQTGVNFGPPFIKTGGKIVYALSAVVAWERQRTVR